MRKVAFAAFAVVTVLLVFRWVNLRRAGESTGVPPALSSSSGPSQVASQSAQPAFTPRAQASPTPEDEAKALLLEKILAARNDNDPRLDTEFNHLTLGARYLLEQRYQALAPEKRNERGTIVFLIGRNLAATGGSSEDLAFLHAVLAEPPCLSMADCQRDTAPPTGSEAANENSHLEAGMEVSLSYPQLTALDRMEQAIAAINPHADSMTRANLLKEVDVARSSRSQIVANKANAIWARFGGPRSDS